MHRDAASILLQLYQSKEKKEIGKHKREGEIITRKREGNE